MTTKQIAIIGYGLIGKAIHQLLATMPQFEVHPYDTRPTGQARTIASESQYIEIARHHDAIIVATPYNCNAEIARACATAGTAYFDMSEDVQTTAMIKELAKAGGWFMPQCGLAPGAVSIIAKHLFDTLQGTDIRDIEIRVGALPVATNNHAKYYLTWSSDGLVNEYSNPCHAILNGIDVELLPLQGVENVIIDGCLYEAFNTSGGLGTLRDSLKGNVLNLNYKTLRYPGHRDYFSFLLNDLGLSNRRQLLVDILNQELPHITNDVVVIMICAAGKERDDRGWVRGETYSKKVYGTSEMSAIQLTTASGLCAAVHWWSTLSGDDATGFKRSEDIPWDFFIASPFSSPYRV